MAAPIEDLLPHSNMTRRRTTASRLKYLREPQHLRSKAVAYLRTSTEEQQLGIDGQRESIEAWARSNQILISEWYVDQGISGRTDPADRDGLRALLYALEKREIDYVVVTKIDRIGRLASLVGFVEFVAARNYCRVLTIDQNVTTALTAEQQLMRTITTAFAEYERALNSYRTKAALRAKRARGEQIGRRLRSNDLETCALIYVSKYLQKQGKMPRQIAGYLLSQGIKVDHTTVWRYLREKKRPDHFPLTQIKKILKDFYKKEQYVIDNRTSSTNSSQVL